MRNAKSKFKILNLNFSFLTFHFTFVFFMAMGLCAYAASSDHDETIEKEIMRQAEEQKNAQLKDYFKEYYLNEGRDYFKRGLYKEAYIKFKRALYWSPGYEPVNKYMQLAERKVTEEYLKDHIDEIVFSGGLAPTVSPGASQGNQGSAYHLGVDDTLEIFIGGHPELSQELAVRTDGTIFFPPVGVLRVVGLTLSQAEEDIVRGLTKDINDPQIALTVKSFGRH